MTITPKEPNLNVPSMYSSSGHTNVNERPWFSILPLGNPIDHSPRLDFEQGHSVSESGHSIQERLMSLTPLQPQIVALEEKLESVRKLNIDDKRMPIPKGLKIVFVISTGDYFCLFAERKLCSFKHFYTKILHLEKCSK